MTRKSDFHLYATPFNELLSKFIDHSIVALKGSMMFGLLQNFFEGGEISEPPNDVPPTDGQIFIMSLIVLGLFLSFCRSEGQGVGRWLSIMDKPLEGMLNAVQEFQKSHPDHPSNKTDVGAIAKDWVKFRDAYYADQEGKGDPS
jgi:hypothetical protein